MKLFAIDPGNEESAFCQIDYDTYKPLWFNKVRNEELENTLKCSSVLENDNYVIERVACYGMPVGREVFETCEWIGRFSQIIKDTLHRPVDYIYRKEEKLYLCHDLRAKDRNIRSALIERFAEFDFKNGKGTMRKKDWFYGFSRDIWAAYACGIAYLDKMERKDEG